MIKITPAIDLIEGRCVRLTRGDYLQKTVYDGSPVDVARSYADCGVERIHLVDLDGAKLGSPQNLRTLEAIAKAVSCELEWGGGLGSDEALKGAFDAGATHAVIGSVAVRQPDLLEAWLKQYGAKIILGADVRDERIAISGWRDSSPLGIEDLVSRFLPMGLQECIVTEISRDGMLQGPAASLYVRLQREFPTLSFTVSGGIGSMSDIHMLDALHLRKVIVGKAIYENHITLEDIKSWSQSASSPASM
ncbi:MAG: 1-(5-phosphoribosyl)-5-[(5-phosphoribosylamino)methylideneamino]imidazole-4-carboxamide isomerase [Bacteroidales bacterium]|nr:1-(5-phosphoribosyl)-5-[(5-phosphoribosylamino)methylideneamino]imidazole-4-carboxamide isomerase [Bacteroidales bacterium]